MIFRDLKIGFTLYIFDRTKAEVKNGKVTSVSVPRLETKIGVPAEMIVDICVDIDGKNTTYSLKDSSEVGYTQTLVISANKDCILREVELLKNQSEQALLQVEAHKEKVARCEEILINLNPIIKDKRETEERFSKIESTLDRIKSLIEGLNTKIN